MSVGVDRSRRQGASLTRDVPDPAVVERALRRWLEESGTASYDPYDGLACSRPWSLVLRHRFLARLWTQAIKQCPLNLRPVVGIRPQVHAKSLADQAHAALLRHRLGTDAEALAVARRFLQELEEHALRGYAGACWGTPFPYVTRYIRSDAGEPNLFWTVCAAETLMTAYELTGDRGALERARSTLDFICHDLGFVDEGKGGVWFRYFIGHEASVFNVSALTGSLMLRIGRHTREDEILALGRRALQFVLRGQNEDGSWFYARGSQGRWVDGFHTGYILESLIQAYLLEGGTEIGAALERGKDFYLQRMFTSDSRPRYMSNDTYPMEVQNCAQAIQTLAKLCWLHPEGISFLRSVARSVTEALFRLTEREPEEKGYFILNRGRWLENRLPAIRWGQAPMLLALSFLLSAEEGLGPPWHETPRNSPRSSE